MDAQPRNIFPIEITVSAAAVEVLQYRILRIHMEQIVWDWEAVLVSTILTVAAKRPLVAWIRRIRRAIIPGLIHSDSFQKQSLPFWRQSGQFGKKRIEICYRAKSAAQLKWDQLACAQARILALYRRLRLAQSGGNLSEALLPVEP